MRIISLGRVYRPDTADATHYPMFHQIEGLLVDRHVTMADLKSVLRLFATSYLGDDVHIRFRPSFFPFTEPSVEVDMRWHDRWIEIGGAGMVDPNVLSAVGYDPEEVHRLRLRPGRRAALHAPARHHRHPRVLQERRAVSCSSSRRYAEFRATFRTFRHYPHFAAMIVSWNWLKDYVPLAITPEQLVQRLMMAGLNLEKTEALGNDVLIDLEITSNRPDCLGHIGIAREVAVLCDLPLTVAEPAVPVASESSGRIADHLSNYAASRSSAQSFARATPPASFAA